VGGKAESKGISRRMPSWEGRNAGDNINAQNHKDLVQLAEGRDGLKNGVKGWIAECDSKYQKACRLKKKGTRKTRGGSVAKGYVTGRGGEEGLKSGCGASALIF
jgi:hypothetical protein